MHDNDTEWYYLFARLYNVHPVLHRDTLRQLDLVEDVPRKAVCPNHVLPLQSVPTNFGQDNGPDYPVDEARGEEAKANHDMEPVGKRGIRCFSCRRRY